MSEFFDVDVIKHFLPQTDTEMLRDFCQYQLEGFQARRGGDLADLHYDNFAGGVPQAKASSIIDKMKQRKELPELVIYLTAWWFDEKSGKEEGYRASGMPRELCLAAQMLWPSDRDLAVRGMDYLARVDRILAAVWKSDTLKHAATLGPIKTVKELTDHLARCRELDDQINRSVSEHQWVKAVHLWHELENRQPGYGEETFWVNGPPPVETAAALDRIVAAAEAGFVYDERLPWGRSYPYVRTREIGSSITPASSMEQVQTELRERKDMPEDGRASLEHLGRSEAERLFVDLFIYPDRITCGTALAIEETFLRTGLLPSSSEIDQRYPQEAAMLMVLMDEPRQAADRWQDAQRRRPLDGRIAHNLGLLSLGLTPSLSAQPAEQWPRVWQRTIAQWAMAMSDTAYWVAWGRQRSETYGSDFVFTTILGLGVRLQNYVAALLTTEREQAVERNEADLAAALTRLQQDLAIEFSTVRLVNALGGIELHGGRVACFGPLGMAELQAENALAEYCARTRPGAIRANALPSGLSPEEALRRLRWMFSELRDVALLVDTDPSGALEALQPAADDTSCGHADCPCHDARVVPLRVPCPYAEEFSQRNPAYAAMTNRCVQLGEDALLLAVDAHLHFLHAQMNRTSGATRETLQSEWQALLELAARSADPAAIHVSLRTFLEEISGPSQLSEARLGTVITMLEVSIAQKDQSDDTHMPLGAQDRALKNRLAGLLLSRALVRLDQDPSGAESDLSRALKISPHNHDIRSRLATLWCNQASSLAFSDRFEALNYLRRAEQLVKEGQKDYPGFDYSNLLIWIETARARFTHPAPMRFPFPPAAGQEPSIPEENSQAPPTEVMTAEHVRLYRLAVQDLLAGKIDSALQTFDKALWLAPDDLEIQAGAASGVVASAVRRIDQGRSPEGLAIIEEWKPRLPTRADHLGRQAEFLRAWPQLRAWLQEKSDDFFWEQRDYQRLIFPFKAQHVASVIVTLQVDKDDLYFQAPLPLVAAAEEETVLTNLLKATRDLPLFKAACLRNLEFQLCCHVPLDVLEGASFFLLIFELSQFADISHSHLLQLDLLRNWFRETRQGFVQAIDSREYLASFGKAVEQLCRERELAFERLTEVRYDISLRSNQISRVTMEAWTDGARLSLPLGELPEPARRAVVLRRLADLNTRLQWGKLTLSETEQMLLSVELPYLEPATAQRALDMLERKAPIVRQELGL